MARPVGCIVHGAPRRTSLFPPWLTRIGVTRSDDAVSWPGAAGKRRPSTAGARMSTVDPERPPSGGDGGPPPADLPAAESRSAPTVLRMLLGTQLRRLREECGVTPERAGYEIRASRSKISRMETGHVGFKARDITDLLTLYGVSDEQVRTRLLAMAQQSGKPDWWSQYSDILP